MKSEKPTNRTFLPWPWNVVVYVLTAGVLGYWIGYLWSVLLVMLFARYQRGKNPGMPQEGYCMARTRSQLKQLPLGLVFTVLGGAFLWALWYGHHHALPMEQKAEIGFLVGGPLLLLLGLFVSYYSIRDSFFPEKSCLAQSIRSQLPYPDEAPPVAELFAMVDRDLKENGLTFDRVMIGKEWILGDDASYIPRIRGVFGQDEIRTRRRGNKVTTVRKVALYIVDDRGQQQYTDLRNPRELPMILDCLELRAPDAYFGDYSELDAFRNVSDETQSERERAYRRRQADKQLQNFQNPPEQVQKVVLTAYDVGPTSRVDEDALRRILEGDHRNEGLALVAGKPVSWQSVRYGTLWCHPDLGEGTRLMLEESAPGANEQTMRNGLYRFVQSDEEAIHILLTWADGQICQPELWKSGQLKSWQAIDLHHRDSGQRPQVHESVPAELRLVSAEGVGQTHNTFTREDIQVAAEGILDSSYQVVRYVKEGGYLLMTVHTGDKSDGRCAVVVSRPTEKYLRFLEIKCSHHQAADWLLAFYDGCFSPNWREWKDVTRRVTK